MLSTDDLSSLLSTDRYDLLLPGQDLLHHSLRNLLALMRSTNTRSSGTFSHLAASARSAQIRTLIGEPWVSIGMQLGVVNDGLMSRKDCRFHRRATRIRQPPVKRDMNHIAEVYLHFVLLQRCRRID